jgi:hypothetical protein
MMERVLNPEQLDQWFNKTAKEQYTKDLLFSSVFDRTFGDKPAGRANTNR